MIPCANTEMRASWVQGLNFLNMQDWENAFLVFDKAVEFFPGRPIPPVRVAHLELTMGYSLVLTRGFLVSGTESGDLVVLTRGYGGTDSVDFYNNMGMALQGLQMPEDALQVPFPSFPYTDSLHLHLVFLYVPILLLALVRLVSLYVPTCL